MPAKKTTPAQLIDELPDWLPREAWDGWLDIRRQLKAKVNERVIKLALRELDVLRQAGEDLELVIDQSSAKNWLSFYPYKGPKPQPQAAAQHPTAVAHSAPSPEGVGQGDAAQAARVPMPAEVREKMRRLVGGFSRRDH